MRGFLHFVSIFYFYRCNDNDSHDRESLTHTRSTVCVRPGYPSSSSFQSLSLTKLTPDMILFTSARAIILAIFGLVISIAHTAADTSVDMITTSDSQLVEGISGTAEMIFKVTSPTEVPGGFSVDFSTNTGTADATDFTAVNGTLVFDGNAKEVKTIAVSIIGDNMVELDETFSVQLSNLQASDSGVTLGQTTATGIIINDDAAIVRIRTLSDGGERDPGELSFFCYSLRVDNPVDVDVLMTQSYEGGTAVVNEDFLGGGTEFKIRSNVSQGFCGGIINDNVAEPNKTIRVTFSNIQASGRNVTFLHGRDSITASSLLRDDDYAPVGNDDGPYLVTENSTITVDPASGLLANDTDRDDDDASLVVTRIVKKPDNGTLAVNANGGFTYTPEAEYFGNDTFIYELSDGTNVSQGTTSITVKQNVNYTVSVVSPPALSLQSGLFISQITVTNLTGNTVAAHRVFVSGLPADVVVHNASGMDSYGTLPAGTPYLLSNLDLADGTSVVFTVEYHRGSLDPDFTPQYTVDLLAVDEATASASAEGTSIERIERLTNGDILIEFASQPGAVYAVEYSADMKTWTRVKPEVKAVANRTQWTDNGLPKTINHPSSVSQRLYRFVHLAPAK
jgi:hypothetical protein